MEDHQEDNPRESSGIQGDEVMEIADADVSQLGEETSSDDCADDDVGVPETLSSLLPPPELVLAPKQFMELHIQLYPVILRACVVGECRQDFLDRLPLLTHFNENVSIHNLGLNQTFDDWLRVTVIRYCQLYGSVCSLFNDSLRGTYYQGLMRQSLFNSVPGLKYNPRPGTVRLTVMGLDPYVVPHTVIGYPGHAACLTEYNSLVVYTARPDLINAKLQLRELFRGHIDAEGVTVRCVLPVKTTTGFVLLLYIVKNRRPVLWTYKTTGEKINEWKLNRWPRKIWADRAGHIIVSSDDVYPQFCIISDTTLVYDINGVKLTEAEVEERLRLPRYYNPTMELYETLGDGHGAVITAHAGRGQLVTAEGKLVQPRLFTFPYKVSEGLGCMILWVDREEGVLCVKDLECEPQFLSVYRQDLI